MSDPTPERELTCPTCGAPIKTTAQPGTTVKCDCCGATSVIPETETPAAEASQ